MADFDGQFRAHQVGMLLVDQFHTQPVVTRTSLVAEQGDWLVEMADNIVA
jgi:hypothetical protein